MVTIIEKGKLETFITVCPKCSCKFSYQEPDLTWYTLGSIDVLAIECPTCRKVIRHEDVKKSSK